MSTCTASLQAFFTTYLSGQRAVSPHTVDAYRDTFRLLLTYLHDKIGLIPDQLQFTDLDAQTVGGFLHYLEAERRNTVRSRNARLAAIHSFFTYASYNHPEHADLIARVLAIRRKNTSTTVLTYLTGPETEALLRAPDQRKETGQRDYVIMLLLITTGLRVSELTALTRQDIHPETPAHLICHGKGRKDRLTPLNKQTAGALRQWITHSHEHDPMSPLFTAQGGTTPISRDAIAARLRVHATTAVASCPSLATKNITPHVLRHTTAMRMLEAGIDIATIALWLGHESTQSTQAYLHADLAMKQQAMNRMQPNNPPVKRYRPTGSLLKFLESL
jgi:integrase/recombinase XerD